MEPITERQQQVLKCIVEHRRRHGRIPTYREIGKAARITSTNGVRRHLGALEKKGYLAMSRSARGLELAEPVKASLSIPLLGRIAAGRPIEALENFEGMLDLGEAFGGHPDCFALRVQGDSMTGAGILNGDIVIIQATPKVRHGEIAAVAVNEEATVKKVEFGRESIKLVPANPSYRVMEFQEGDAELRILGRVVG